VGGGLLGRGGGEEEEREGRVIEAKLNRNYQLILFAEFGRRGVETSWIGGRRRDTVREGSNDENCKGKGERESRDVK